MRHALADMSVVGLMSIVVSGLWVPGWLPLMLEPRVRLAMPLLQIAVGAPLYKAALIL